MEPVEPFVRPEEAPPVAHAADLETDEEYSAAPPAPLEWTPERAASVLQGVGLVLHAADGITDVKPPTHADRDGALLSIFGDSECSCDSCRLWKLTRSDALQAGEPFARILNRYDAARRLAGMSDEGEFAFAMLAYARSHLAARGRLVRHRRELQAELRGPAHVAGLPFDGAEPVVPAPPAGETVGGTWAGPGFLPPPPPEEPGG